VNDYASGDYKKKHKNFYFREHESIKQLLSKMGNKISIQIEQLQQARDNLEVKVEQRTLELRQTLSQLEETKKEMEEDLIQGGIVQRGLLELEDTGNFSIDYYNKPYKGWVGGDGFTFLKNDQGDYWLRVSDGTGHGSSGGEAEIVDHLIFSEVIKHAETVSQAMGMISTALKERFPNANLTYAYFLARITCEGQIEYINARQLAFHQSNTVTRLNNSPLIVGEPDNFIGLSDDTLKMDKGDSLLITTDGIFEARFWNQKKSKSSLVGKRRIENVVDKTTEDIADHFFALPKFEQTDDILLVKLTRN